MVSADDAWLAVVAAYVGPVRPGLADCCSAPCDAFRALHGVDPMAPLRGTYDDWPEARARVRQMGGWRRMFATLARRAGLVAGQGAPGEIGLIALPGHRHLGLCVGGDWWAIRVDGGVQTVPGALIRAAVPAPGAR